MQAQCILFRRYPEMLAPFKYGGYPLLLSAVTLPEDSEESNASHFLGSEKAPLLEVRCCVLSCHRLCEELWQCSVVATTYAVRQGYNLTHLAFSVATSCNETKHSKFIPEVLFPFSPPLLVAQGQAGCVRCPDERKSSRRPQSQFLDLKD